MDYGQRPGRQDWLTAFLWGYIKVWWAWAFSSGVGYGGGGVTIFNTGIHSRASYTEPSPLERAVQCPQAKTPENQHNGPLPQNTNRNIQHQYEVNQSHRTVKLQGWGEIVYRIHGVFFFFSWFFGLSILIFFSFQLISYFINFLSLFNFHFTFIFYIHIFYLFVFLSMYLILFLYMYFFL